MKRKYPRGHFRKLIKEGKLKIEFASTKKISAYEDLAADFLDKIFDMERGSYAISDESGLWDFPFRESYESKERLWEKIREIYGVDVSDIKDGNLVRIFERIEREQKPPC